MKRAVGIETVWPYSPRWSGYHVHIGLHVARLEQKGSNFFEINPLLISVSSSLTGSTHQR
jgi:hypothetical protein